MFDYFSIWKNRKFNPNFYVLYFPNIMTQERRGTGEGEGFRSLRQELLEMDEAPLIELASDPPTRTLVFRYEGKELIPTLNVLIIPGPDKRPVRWKSEMFDETDTGFRILVMMIKSDTYKICTHKKKRVTAEI